MEPVTALKITHLVGLALGFGGALIADATLLSRAVLKPATRGAAASIRYLSVFVAAGLGLLWLSGTGLVIEGFARDPAFAANPKLWAKIAIVAALTLNGALIHRIAFPALREARGRRLLFDGPRGEALRLSAIGSLSFTGWSAALALGAAKELNGTTPASLIIGAFVLAALLVWSLWIAAIAGGARRHRQADPAAQAG